MKDNSIIPERIFCLNRRITADNFMQTTNKLNRPKTLLVKRYGHFVIHERKKNFQRKILDHEKKFHPGCLLATGHASSTRPCVESRLADVVS